MLSVTDPRLRTFDQAIVEPPRQIPGGMMREIKMCVDVVSNQEGIHQLKLSNY
jgi:hypothetical protein